MHPILPTGRHDLFFDENTALKITNSLVRNCCARESSTMVFRNMSDDDYVAIQKLRHPITRATVYLPAGQALPDTKTTLERDGLISCQYDEYGKCVSTVVHDPLSIRVLCWHLSLRTCWQICAKISPSERGLTPRARTYLNAAGRVSGPRKFDGGVLVFPRRSWIVCHGGPTHHGAESGVCVVVRVPLARADGH